MHMSHADTTEACSKIVAALGRLTQVDRVLLAK